MKKNLLKKLLSISLVGVLVAGMMTGCSNNTANDTSAPETEIKEVSTAGQSPADTEAATTEEPTEEPAVGVTYPLDTDVTLKILTVEAAAVTAHYDSLQDTPFIEELQKRTGVKVEIYEYSSDALKLLLSGGDLSDYDILWADLRSNLPSSAETCIEDGLIIPLDDYLDECMPDYKALLENNDLYRRDVTTLDGNVYRAAPFYEELTMNLAGGMIIRWDWLKDLGMEIPETPDELYDVLVAFRDEKGAEVPMSAQGFGNLIHNGGIGCGFGLPSESFYVVDGKVHLGQAEPALKDVFAYLNKLYNEGLFDSEFATIDAATAKANIMNGRSGVWYGAVGGGIGVVQTQMAETDPEFELTGFPALVATKGDPSIKPAPTQSASYVGATILPGCKNPEIAAKFLNYGYTEEGINFWNFGIEGVSYNMVDGYPTYTDLIMKNPDGWTVQQAMAGYSRGWSGPISIQQLEYLEQYSSLPGQRKALENWWKVSEDNVTALPYLVYSDEVSAEYSRISSECSTYFNQMVVAYINGTKSLDTFESEYLATMKSLGVDRLIEIVQEAYDAYMAK